MPHNVAQMEDAARHPYSPPVQQANGWGQQQMPPRIDSQQPAAHSVTSPTSSYTTATPTSASVYSQASPATYQQPNYTQIPQAYQQQSYSSGLPETPNFSPFPRLRNPAPNIPPTDEEKENTLNQAREAVLACNNFETQLTWAADVLQHVDVAQQNEERLSQTQNARPRTPRVERQLREDALKIVNFLADQHHPKAEFYRGTWLEFGKFGERVDKKEAFHCYSRASEKGYARAFYRIGMQFETGNDALKAVKYYQRGVDMGDAAACYRLGMMTLLGQHGQYQDFERGISLIYQSAQNADENAPQGAYVYGMLKAGELNQVNVPERFCPRDTLAAKENIEKSAYLGFAKAQVRMGAAYELGELACPFDAALSLHYNALAARQGETEAEMAISKWFLCGQEGVFDKNEEMAFTYAQRAAVSGLAAAQFAMGYFYEVGIYVQSDYSTAQEWYRKAAENGNQDAAGRVDAIKRSKTLSRKDHEQTALNRIKQSRGPGAQQAAPSSSLDMPDPSRLTLNSTSSAPYPQGPIGMPHSVSSPDMRPTSAFGVNPNLRSSSAAPYGHGPNGMPPPQARPPPQNYGGSYGPGRTPSAPPQQGYPSQNTGPGGRPPMGRPGTTSPYMHPQDQRPPQPNAAPVDIGFTAPLENRRPRPQHPAEAPRPRPPPGHMSPAPGTQPRPGPQQQQRPQPPSQPSAQPQKPPPKPSTPQPQQKPNKVAPNKVPRPGVVSQGQGPSTFEEMGIPAKKDKGDCVSLRNTRLILAKC